MLDTPEQIEMFQLLRLAAAIALEINTGMRASAKGSAIKTLAAMGISSKKTKRGVLGDLVEYIKTKDANYAPNPRVAQALASK